MYSGTRVYAVCTPGIRLYSVHSGTRAYAGCTVGLGRMQGVQ